MATTFSETSTPNTVDPSDASRAEEAARFDAAFEELLEAWNHHQDLRYSSPSLDQLLRSRNELDARRRHARTARRCLV